MNTQTVASPVNATLDPAPRVPGRVRVRERVIDKVVREASAAAIGVPRGDVEVDVSEWGGGLTVRIATKLLIPDLQDTEAILAGSSILDRARALQTALAGEFAWLTGRDIRRVTFTVTGAVVPERKRVR